MFGRGQGVTISESQRNAGKEKGPPGTISHAYVVEQIALQWFDESGKAHDDVWLKIGDNYFIPPESELWASKLSQVKDTFARQLVAMMQDSEIKDVAPTKDAVDVVAANVASQPAVAAAPPANVDV